MINSGYSTFVSESYCCLASAWRRINAGGTAAAALHIWVYEPFLWVSRWISTLWHVIFGRSKFATPHGASSGAQEAAHHGSDYLTGRKQESLEDTVADYQLIIEHLHFDGGQVIL